MGTPGSGEGFPGERGGRKEETPPSLPRALSPSSGLYQSSFQTSNQQPQPCLGGVLRQAEPMPAEPSPC